MVRASVGLVFSIFLLNTVEWDSVDKYIYVVKQGFEESESRFF